MAIKLYLIEEERESIIKSRCFSYIKMNIGIGSDKK